ncbi:aldehyde dehydrogenase family protein, partial [Magnetococcales bacterium HHB-1]
PLVEDERVAVISFTGSTRVGQLINKTAAERMARVSLELGGKNPLVVCDDAAMDNALKWVLLSAFSNAGQRCASGSRILVFDSIYETFRDRLIEETKKLKLGVQDDDDFGPLINETQLANILEAIKAVQARGGKVSIGGGRLTSSAHKGGYYMAPTVLEDVSPQDPFSQSEIFGPVTTLYRVKDLQQAIAIANENPFGLTAAIHTRNVDRAIYFAHQVKAGVVNVNIGTYGSEPHMPFGGFGLSGNGTREPGTEALDVYSETKNMTVTVDPARL